jgi:nicotinamidase/pyrazinamidase
VSLTWGPETALVAVDLQNDFAHPDGSLYVRGGEQVIPVVNRLVEEARRAGSPVVYSKDWHPEQTPHFRTSGGPWPEHCRRGTWGAELVRELAIASPALFVHKGTGGEDGYSAFTVRDPVTGERRPTGLDAALRRLGVTRLVLAGIATDYCVRETALDALALGYRPAVVRAAVRAVDLAPGDGDRALAEIAARGALVVGDAAAAAAP